MIILISKKKSHELSLSNIGSFITAVHFFSLVPLISLYHLAHSYFKLYFFGLGFAYPDGIWLPIWMASLFFVTNTVVVVVLCWCSSALPSVHLGHILHVNLSTVFLQLCQNTVQLPNSKCIFRALYVNLGYTLCDFEPYQTKDNHKP